MNFYKIGKGRVFVVIFLGLVCLTSYFILFNYFNSISDAKRESLERLQSIAKTLTLSIDGDSLDHLLTEYSYKNAILRNNQNSSYDKFHQLLSQCYEINKLKSPVYTIHYNEHTDAFDFGITSSEEPYFRHQYPDTPENLKDMYFNGGVIEKYETERGEWLSVISPIRNKKEQVIGAIEMDLPFFEFMSEARSDLLKNSLISLGIYLIVGILIFQLVSKILKVEEKQAALENFKKKENEYKHRELGSSISYARKIQKALWPDNEVLRKYFSDFFAFNLPKDTVSGDFYWHHKISGTEKYIIIHADCTGHGVPGAMMSVLGNTLFNEVVVNYGITEPAQILNLTNKKLIHLLQQEKDENLDDGMAVSIVLVNKENMTLKYAGANQNSVLIRNGQMIDLPGDKYPVGGAHYNPKRTYKSSTTLLEEGDSLYLFSDGFKDQFGGPQNKKFLSSNFYRLLLEHSRKQMTIQKTLILDTFRSWKGDMDQIDDVSLVGLKL